MLRELPPPPPPPPPGKIRTQPVDTPPIVIIKSDDRTWRTIFVVLVLISLTVYVFRVELGLSSIDTPTETPFEDRPHPPIPKASQAEQDRAKVAQEKKDVEQKAAMEGLMAELRALKDEEHRLAMEKQALDNKLNNVTDAAELQRLLTEKAALNAQIAENSKEQTKKRVQTKTGDDGKMKGIIVKKNVNDPLDGL
ncbi:hypothetical protein [Nannocystis sp.]|uniref:hypothetical protein n=1 Tax=Nannocystis sp. TaxID=1962667 RepID=UPI0025FF05F0|nr:hypothetical protein [Nannocystis sp.]MBK7829747.1 hypothetical protein [Nannocystis sp.]